MKNKRNVFIAVGMIIVWILLVITVSNKNQWTFGKSKKSTEPATVACVSGTLFGTVHDRTLQSGTIYYYFAGFIDEDTFSVDVESYNIKSSYASNFYFKAKKDTTYKLPKSNAEITILDYNIEDGTMTVVVTNEKK